MRAVLDADTVPDLTKRRLLVMGAARGLDFDRLVGVSMWDEASGVVSRADGDWPSVEGFEAAGWEAGGSSLAASAAAYTPPPGLADWRAGTLPPALAEVLDAVAAESAFIADRVVTRAAPSNEPRGGGRGEGGGRRREGGGGGGGGGLGGGGDGRRARHAAPCA